MHEGFERLYKPKPTCYKGIIFPSLLEARVAISLDHYRKQSPAPMTSTDLIDSEEPWFDDSPPRPSGDYCSLAVDSLPTQRYGYTPDFCAYKHQFKKGAEEPAKVQLFVFEVKPQPPSEVWLARKQKSVMLLANHILKELPKHITFLYGFFLISGGFFRGRDLFRFDREEPQVFGVSRDGSLKSFGSLSMCLTSEAVEAGMCFNPKDYRFPVTEYDEEMLTSMKRLYKNYLGTLGGRRYGDTSETEWASAGGIF